jgi:hypothetical protein
MGKPTGNGESGNGTWWKGKVSKKNIIFSIKINI